MKSVLIAMEITCITFIVISCSHNYTTIKAYPAVNSNQSESRAPGDTGFQTAPDSLLNNGLHLFHMGDYEAAVTVFSQSAAEYPADWRCYYYLGLTQNEIHNYDSAIINLESSLNLAPGDRLTRSTIYLSLGESWEKLENPGKAMLSFHTALNLNPESEDARLALNRLQKYSSKK